MHVLYMFGMFAINKRVCIAIVIYIQAICNEWQHISGQSILYIQCILELVQTTGNIAEYCAGCR